MAIKLFQAETSSGDTQRPFLNNLLKDELEILTPAKVAKKWLEQPFLINRVTLAKSGKGAIFQADAFSVFLFRNTSLFRQVFEALDHYVDELGQAPGLVVIPTDLNGKYNLGIDDERIFFIRKKGGSFEFKNSEFEETGSTENGNPFLISLNPSMDDTDVPGTEDTTKAKPTSTTKKRSQSPRKST